MGLEPEDSVIRVDGIGKDSIIAFGKGVHALNNQSRESSLLRLTSDGK